VGEVLANKGAVMKASTTDHPEFLFVEPLANDRSCQTCHGPDKPLRGAKSRCASTRRPPPPQSSSYATKLGLR